MNKSTATIVAVAGVLAIGGYFLFSNRAPQTEPAPQQEQAMEKTEPSEESVKDKFANLLKLGKNLKCTFEQVDGINALKGTTYVASGGDRVRGDFTLTQGDNVMEGNVIRNDGWNYTWGSFSEQGFKSKVTEEDKDKLFDNKDASVDEEVDFDCKIWRVDNSVFNLPSDVEFTDITAQIKQIEEAQDTLKKAQCSACDQVPAGASRDQCLQALGCS